MNFEQLLKDDYERTRRRAGPAGAYDRFLRRRARYGRRMLAATSATLAAVLAVAVACPGCSPTATRSPTAPRTRWSAGPRSATSWWSPPAGGSPARTPRPA